MKPTIQQIQDYKNKVMLQELKKNDYHYIEAMETVAPLVFAFRRGDMKAGVCFNTNS